MEVESQHPYRDSARDAWLVQRRDAQNQIQKTKIHFSKVELLQETDWIEIYSEKDGQRELEMVLQGNHQDFWSPELDGQRVWIVLNTDTSDSGWGFQVDQASYYELLPEGSCNRSEDCDADKVCVSSDFQCDNPDGLFSPCYGQCQIGQRFLAIDTPVVIPDNDPNGLKRAIEVETNLNCAIDVYMDVSISHPFQGDLKLSVFDPNGREIVLLNHQQNDMKNFNLEGKQIVASALPSAVNGIWTILVSDTVRNDIGALNYWTLYLTCH
jgi:hypothetical protein